MFSALAGFTQKYKIPIIIVWLAVAAVLVILAPSLSKVGVTDDSQFLPRNTESIQAQEIIKSRFTNAVAQSAGSTTIVIYDAGGFNSADQQIIEISLKLTEREDDMLPVFESTYDLVDRIRRGFGDDKGFVE